MTMNTANINLSMKDHAATGLEQVMASVPDKWAIEEVSFGLAKYTSNECVTVYFTGPEGTGAITVEVDAEGDYEIAPPVVKAERGFAEWLLDELEGEGSPASIFLSYWWDVAYDARRAASRGLSAILQSLNTTPSASA